MFEYAVKARPRAERRRALERERRLEARRRRPAECADTC